MIAVNDILAQVRIDVKDMDEVRVSDWDILNALNKTLRIAANYFATKNTDFFDKSLHIEAEEAREGIDLPDDYITVRQVVRDGDHYLMSPSTGGLNRGTYVVTNNRFYAKVPCTMFYKGYVEKAEKDGELSLPMTFFDILCMTTRLIMDNGTTDVVIQYVADEAQKIIPRRKYANVKIKMDFDV